jgi:hypothetical protein
VWLTKKGGTGVQLAWGVSDHATADRRQS